MLSTLTVLFFSYIIGSIPSALWVGKIFKGIDIRDFGSGNVGTANTFRVLGWPFGVIVFIMDFMKGFVSSYWLSQYAFTIFSGPLSPPNWEVEAFLKITCGLFAVIGHMFSFMAQFKGGKGVATACGMLFGIEPLSIGISFAIYAIIILITKYSSLASIIATTVYPITLLIMRYVFGYFVDGSIIIFAIVVSFIIVYKHKANIQRLIAGTENRIGRKKVKEEVADL